ncbi:MAG: site-specific DNA-methyltransferase [Pseudomonadales bacterium]|nr:site-specific DNA-methyltransferase [Pseudomonadales bacterium]
MAIHNQVIEDNYALYNGDCIEVMQSLPDHSVHLSIYSPPFAGLYNYSSDDRDLSNCSSYEEFMEHYAFVVREKSRITIPGRMTCVHCMDVPRSNSGTDSYIDFPGDIIRLHEREGWKYAGRHMIWKEPLEVRLRTMQKNLAHASLVADSIDCGIASADYLLLFRRNGANPIPVSHPVGMLEYSGEKAMPSDIVGLRGYDGKQTENRYSHWIWRQYADCMWDDIRVGRVLPYVDSREEDDEKHVHPLQLDVIDRCVALRSNVGETVFTPFMGVGSEVYSPVLMGRKGIGAELKESYFRQAVKNVKAASDGYRFDRQNGELSL